ncbi:S8 family serine peptidase [Planococcus shenhongbingii]|uniref:S8 family serine peptidase n=1 Tax=Planococcus shenhongbingii TaxID=3058398 RepID=A0ABT8NAL1_9BACL|nr:S8 family serine peptidase [Planococcus sp. N017]MDN7244702.1 S8 family serine peptidase [Planococcus sp. N017]
MEKHSFWKVFSSLVALIMILTLLFPYPAATPAAANSPSKSAPPSESQLQMQSAIAEQARLLERGPTLHKDLQGLPSDKQVNVIVHLSQRPVALEQGIQASAGKTITRAEVGAVKAAVVAQQTAVKTQIQSQQLSVTAGYSYNTVLNGFSAKVKAGDLKKLLAIKGVILIEPDVRVQVIPVVPKKQAQASLSSSASFLGVDKLWAEGIEGKGVKVAVLDTGIDRDHPEFKTVFKGGKNFVPNSSQYSKPRAKDDPSETKPSERPANQPAIDPYGNKFATSHGTHVAGIIAATGANDFGFKGIAPKVDLYMYRVLGAYGAGDISQVIAGVEEAVIQDMDVINLSLNGFNTSESEAMAFALNNAVLSGTMAVSAAGNNGLYRGSVGTPATSRLGIAVGNSTLPEERHKGTINATAGSYKLTKAHNLMATTINKDPAKQLAGSLPVVAVPEAGKAADYEGLDVKGKVVLVARGKNEYTDKIRIAKQKGAAAILIHNVRNTEEAPGPSGVFFGDSPDFIPAFDLSRTDGEALRLALAKAPGTVSFGNFTKTTTAGDVISETSSSGPTTPNYDIKPDIIAPGMNILSAIPMYKSDFPKANYSDAYIRNSGTSMSAPHVTGIIALMKQAHPNWTASDFKVALSNTAKLLDTKKYDVFAQGSGRVQAYNAAHPAALAYVQDKAVQNQSGTQVDNIKGSVTFGTQPIKEKNISVSKKIRVKDITGKGGNYKVAIDVKKTAGNAKLTVDKPAFTLAGEQLLNVTLTASKNANAAFGDEIIGYIRISNGTTTIALPFAADLSGVPIVELQSLQISEADLSFNGDGINDKAVVSFTVTGNLAQNSLEIYNVIQPDPNIFEDTYMGHIRLAASMKAGKNEIAFNGKYRPWYGGPLTTLKDGLYQFNFSATPASGNPGFIQEIIFPVFVKTTAPAISGSIKEGKLTGKVTDKYIDYNAELEKYGAGVNYDLNTKLKASYVITRSGKAQKAVPFNLDQKGGFNVTVKGFNAQTDSVKVIVTDAAGNKGQKTIK